MESEYRKSGTEKSGYEPAPGWTFSRVSAGAPGWRSRAPAPAGGERWGAAGTPRAWEGMPRADAAGGRPPQQVPGAMATAGTARPGRPEAAPAALEAARAERGPSPGGARWTRGDRGEGTRAGRASRACGATRCQAEGAGRTCGSRRSARRCPRGLGAAGQRGAAQRARFPAAAAAQPVAQIRRVPPPRSVAAAESPAAGSGAPECTARGGAQNTTEAPGRPPRFCPRGCRLPQTGGRGRGEGTGWRPLPLWAPALAAAAVAKRAPEWRRATHPKPRPHTSRSANWEGGGGRAGGRGAGAGSEARRGENSPANRQSFSALDFWITTSISF